MPKFTSTLNLPQYSSNPSSASDGDMYYNTNSNTVFTRINGVWTNTSSSKTKRTVETFAGGTSGTWLRPDGVDNINIFLASGGGGGGSGALALGPSVANAGGGGGGGASRYVYIRDLYVGNVASVSYQVGAGGAGGAARTYNKASGTVLANQAQSGASGSSGGTSFFGSGASGTYISIAGGSAAGGGVASASGNAVGGGAGASIAAGNTGLYTGSSSFGFYFEAAAPQAGVAGGATTASTASGVLTQAQGVAIPISVPLYGPLLRQNTAPSDATATISSGTFTSSAVSLLSKTQTSGLQCPGAGGASANADSISTAGSAPNTIMGGTFGGGGVAAYQNSSGTFTFTLTASGGISPSAICSGGGGGGGCAFVHNVLASSSTPSTYVFSSGAGGKGSDGIMIIEYFI